MQPEREGREGDSQPMPVPNDYPDIQSAVIADMEARKALGLKRYGSLLKPHNGRDALQDLYEELLDAAVYAKQVIVERDNSKESDEEYRTKTWVDFFNVRQHPPAFRHVCSDGLRHTQFLDKSEYGWNTATKSVIQEVLCECCGKGGKWTNGAWETGPHGSSCECPAKRQGDPKQMKEGKQES